MRPDLSEGLVPHPEFLTPRVGFHKRSSGKRWRPERPHRVTLEDQYIRANWQAIDAICKLNSLPFNSDGEVIEYEGNWRVYEFASQVDAILFWDYFKGRWLRGDELHYPEKPEGLPGLKPLSGWSAAGLRNLR